jgi:hypothetical protein
MSDGVLILQLLLLQRRTHIVKKPSLEERVAKPGEDGTSIHQSKIKSSKILSETSTESYLWNMIS